MRVGRAEGRSFRSHKLYLGLWGFWRVLAWGVSYLYFEIVQGWDEPNGPGTYWVLHICCHFCPHFTNEEIRPPKGFKKLWKAT